MSADDVGPVITIALPIFGTLFLLAYISALSQFDEGGVFLFFALLFWLDARMSGPRSQPSMVRPSS